MLNEPVTLDDFIDTPATLHPKTYLDQIKKMIQDKWSSSTDIINASVIEISSPDYQALKTAYLEEAGMDDNSEKPLLVYHGLKIIDTDRMSPGECEVC